MHVFGKLGGGVGVEEYTGNNVRETSTVRDY